MKYIQITPYIIFLIFIVYNSIGAHSENLISESVYQAGSYYDFNHIFSDASPLQFSLNDSNISGEWSCILKSNSDKTLDMPIDSQGEYCNFDPRSVPFQIWQENAFRTFNSFDNRDEFTLYVSFSSENGYSDTRSVRLALLPCRPSINNIQFEYMYDWEFDQIYPNGNFYFQVEANNAKSFFLHYSESFIPPSENVFFTFVKEFEEENRVNISYNADWGEYISVSARNEFGFVNSDTLYTTDYILDENVIDRINELLNLANHSVVLDDEISFNWDNEILRFNKMPQQLSVYSLDGRKLNLVFGNEEINLSNMKNGIYIISYYDDKTKQYITHKILKK